MTAQASTPRLQPHPARRTPRWAGQVGFTLIELIAVIIILGLLAALIVPRYFGITNQAAQVAAQGAVAESFSRLKQATARYAVDNHGTQPQALADLSPTYLTTPTALGDYTAVFTQGSNQVTIDIYPGTDTTGTPLTTRAFDWP